MRCTMIHRTALALLLSLWTIAGANAATSGIEIDLRPDVPNMVPATSLSWGAKSPLSEDGRLTAVRMDLLRWTQGIDTSVPRYWNFDGGALAPTGSFSLFAPGNAGSRPYLSLTATNVDVASIDQRADSVSVAALYSSIDITYDPKARGLAGAPVVQSFDVATGTPSGLRAPSAQTFTGTRAAADPGGATRIYMKLVDDADDYVPGESVAAGYENWIELDSADLVFGPLAAGTYQALQLRWAQRFDGSVPYLLGRLLSQRTGNRGVVEFVEDAGAGPLTFMQLVFDTALVTELALASDGSDLAAVSGTLLIHHYQRTIWAINDDGTRGAAFSATVDYSNGSMSDEDLPVANIAAFGDGNLAPAVPEPATWMLLCGGAGWLVLVARRKTRLPGTPVAGVMRSLVRPV